MPVFISHRTADDSIARTLNRRLVLEHSINSYVDDIDQRLKSVSQQELTKLLVEEINKCTNLIAVITDNTAGSWWVPFEVGVAKQAPRIICSITDLSDSSLPDYMLEWPRLRGEGAVDKFAQLYKKQRTALKESLLATKESASIRSSRVENFHRELKNLLGQ